MIDLRLQARTPFQVRSTVQPLRIGGGDSDTDWDLPSASDIVRLV